MLAKCCECGKEISDQARRCPHCGFDYTHYRYTDSGKLKSGWLLGVVKNGSGFRRVSPDEFGKSLKQK